MRMIILLIFLVLLHSCASWSLHRVNMLRMSVGDPTTTPLSRAAVIAATTLSKSSPMTQYGPDNFGDIMGGCETIVTVNGDFSPMERILLTANGNMQRIMSAFLSAPVSVKVIKTEKVGNREFDREVDLIAFNKVFCKAIGKIEIFDESCLEAITSGQVGVGQLFRYLGVLPFFRLIGAGKTVDGELWRDYELSSKQFRCRFLETFSRDALLLNPVYQQCENVPGYGS